MANITNHIFHGCRIVIARLDNKFWDLLDNIYLLTSVGM